MKCSPDYLEYIPLITFSDNYAELDRALDSRYPDTYPLVGGVLAWTGTSKYFKRLKVTSFDVLIDDSLNIYTHPLDPYIVKNRRFYYVRRFSIAVFGMRGVNSYIWKKSPYDQSYKDMITRDQVDLMCYIAAYFSSKFSVPVSEVMARSEFDSIKPDWIKRTIYPAFWDFEGHCENLRNKINEYRALRQ